MTKRSFESFIRYPSDPKEVPSKPEKLSHNIMERFFLTGKVSVITGGSGSIGAAIVEGYAQAGSNIAIMDIRENLELCVRLSTTYNIKAKFYRVNLSDPQEVKKVIQTIEIDFGTIDIFVANAGIAWNFGSILNEDSTPEAWKRVFDVDVNSIFYCCKYVGEIFKKKGKGSIIMTASMSAHIVNVPNYQTCYNAAKAAVLHMGRSLAIEFVDFARVNTVSPGYTNTPLSDPVSVEERSKWWALTPKGRECEPDELVGAFIYLASDASSFTTGSDIRVDGGYCSI
ncbi:hypothetical protein CANTEDRAFT_103164 [Yamadazyma tenuis ATCC 10573]|uniref:NAD(P)-binding protein n=1 Tax=Candida tenuis (strain ATCC 10573 / BCRC 21748 / CBS 615 / JCM 9827 / NBRC 10315 / NRRL Y-1498 / VKM Y-70) TaxID=590646 RepID=G3AZQ7_CANTC|nr:uncharacterized protein CANTEDRAFT_103164 [Yamadazyma tenuis ATCC 10573]EGV65213.1 hypothetical protein CANTEDRAFT_103164 [Yamadazyma tenuis ATCC 10573]